MHADSCTISLPFLDTSLGLRNGYEPVLSDTVNETLGVKSSSCNRNVNHKSAILGLLVQQRQVKQSADKGKVEERETHLPYYVGLLAPRLCPTLLLRVSVSAIFIVTMSYQQAETSTLVNAIFTTKSQSCAGPVLFVLVF